jgi:Fe-Mn family superoxide dismutase
MKVILPPLPFEKDSLEPYISEKTLEVHYEKHHKGYVEKLKKLIKNTPDEDRSLDQLIDESQGEIFNNAAQIWNHNFYWNSIKPVGGGNPKGELADALKRDFGSVSEFKKLFGEAAKSRFGSGWAWLVVHQKKLMIVTTSNADNPLVKKQTPLITLDVWEHAYYLDYQNKRDKYIQVFFKNLINWDFALSNLKELEF